MEIFDAGTPSLPLSLFTYLKLGNVVILRLVFAAILLSLVLDLLLFTLLTQQQQHKKIQQSSKQAITITAARAHILNHLLPHIFRAPCLCGQDFIYQCERRLRRSEERGAEKGVERCKDGQMRAWTCVGIDRYRDGTRDEGTQSRTNAEKSECGNGRAPIWTGAMTDERVNLNCLTQSKNAHLLCSVMSHRKQYKWR
uniref:Uncharacterized protein n=1 Tax=Glossina austeni TaxID=7395 RepID=A0A1A9UGC3_GLOAU